MLLIALPVGYITAFTMEMGLTGLWLGYGASALCLALLYARVLMQLDWCKTAEEASSNCEEQWLSTESTQEDDDFKRVYDTTEIPDEFTDDYTDHLKRVNSLNLPQQSQKHTEIRSLFSSL